MESATTTQVLHDDPEMTAMSPSVRLRSGTKEVPVESNKPYKLELVWWPNIIGMSFLHILFAYSFYVIPFHLRTFLYSVLLGIVQSVIGVQLGAHRLYSHKSFKATLPLRALALAFQTISGQNCMYIWVRDHRLHHKYTDSDADPHSAARGFFYSHMGWLMVRKHPDIIAKGRQIDLSDLHKDPLVMFQKKYYWYLFALLSIAFPVSIPVLFWDESLVASFFLAFVFRTGFTLHLTWTVNSWAHYFGSKPYDKNILATESWWVSHWGFGEGWHNYHHTFPYDYKASEFGFWNPTTDVINFFGKLGWAYDFKEAKSDLVNARVMRTGNPSLRGL